MMKTKLLLIVLLFFALNSVHGQRTSNGIGLRLGDPMGITYKKYLPNNKAIEFGLGTAARGWSSNYYRNSFEDYNDYDDYNYRAHNVKSIIYLQARYLLHNDIRIEGLIGDLDWYWGLGAVLKSARVEYRYREELPPHADFREERTDIDIGPEGIIGMEYTFEDIPLSIFGEVSLFIELADRPATLRTFSAAGLRYNF